MPVQFHGDKILFSPSGKIAMHANCCCTVVPATCPAIDLTDWYLYICPGGGSPGTWCPTAPVTDTAINIGPLSNGSNFFGFGALDCDLEYKRSCDGVLIDSCIRTVSTANSWIEIIVSPIADGYEFELFYYYFNLSYSDCDDNVTNFVGRQNWLETATKAKCVAGVYTPGEYYLRGLVTTVFNCDGDGAIGGIGFTLPASLQANPLAQFHLAPSAASIPAC